MIGITSALLDFYLAFYPTIVLFKLLMNWRKKLALSSALGFGYCAAAITSYKTYTLTIVPDRADFTWAVDDLVLWTNIEANCVIIGACIPCLYPLVKKVFGASALSGGTPRHQNQNQGGTIITIGSSPKRQRRPVRPFGLSELDTRNGENKNGAVQERTLHISTTELRAEDMDQRVSESGQEAQEGRQEGEGDQCQPRLPFRQRWQEARRLDWG